MVDLDRLGHASHLRETGALTEEEFARVKASLLEERGSHSESKNWWLLAVMAVGVSIVAALFFLLPQSRERAALAQLPPTATTELTEQVIPPTPPVQAPVQVNPSNNNLQFATSDEVIGLNGAYLEKKLGVPREKNEYVLAFEVEGCEISYSLNKGEVTSLSTDITTSCQPTIRGTRIVPSVTYAQLKKNNPWGSYVASCLTGCGNAADPTIYLSFPGARATAYVSVSYSGEYGEVSSALELWEQAVRSQQGLGEFDLPENYDPFICASDPPSAAIKLLGKVKVTTVNVSRQLKDAC